MGPVFRVFGKGVGELGREGAFGTSDIGYEITFTIFA